MILLNLQIDNIYLYEKFEMSFTYDRKLHNNSIEYEWVKEFPNFKYRKVNILLGANSSGKTSLGNIMMSIQNFLSKHNEQSLPLDKVRDNRRVATIEVDFYEKGYLYKYLIRFNRHQIVEDQLKKVKLVKADSYLKASKRLEQVFHTNYDVAEVYNPIHLKTESFDFGWYYSFSHITEDSSKDTKLDVKYLETILKGFDCTVKTVKRIPGNNNAFSVEFLNKDSILIENGELTGSSKNRISSGTYESIRIANILEEIRNQERNYFIDENLVYTHTELEKEVLNFMIAKLNGDSQLFFTTHNMDILEMNLPIHSFQFLKNNHGRFDVVDVSKQFSKNDRNLRNYVEADVFRTLPDTSFILELLDNA